MHRNLFALVLLFCTLAQISIQSSDGPLYLPQEVIDVMGSREMRYHHFIWHNIRETWNTLDEDTKQAITDLGWAPPRPSLSFPADGSAPVAIEDNDSGEDFLYMHRQMVNQVNDILAQVGGPYERVVGWKSTPAPDSAAYPVPCPYVLQGAGNEAFTQMVVDYKTDDFYHNVIVPTEAALKDPDNLRNLTLGQLGSKLEYTSHKYMHVRFSMKTSYGIRAPVYNNPTPDLDSWIDSRYTWLGDTFSSHVHPWFWKIHGWVEDRVRDWQEANGVEEIEWKGTWVGGDGSDLSLSGLFEAGLGFQNSQTNVTTTTPTEGGEERQLQQNDHDDSGDDMSMDMDMDMDMNKHRRMEKVMKLLLATGKESVLYTPISVQSDPLSGH